jgi:hypothetical protein
MTTGQWLAKALEQSATNDQEDVISSVNAYTMKLSAIISFEASTLFQEMMDRNGDFERDLINEGDVR